LGASDFLSVPFFGLAFATFAGFSSLAFGADVPFAAFDADDDVLSLILGFLTDSER
jgi:hypothetical protein